MEGGTDIKKIMIVDDNSDVRKTLKRALEFFNPNYHVICVESGNKCFEMLMEKKIPDPHSPRHHDARYERLDVNR